MGKQLNPFKWQFSGFPKEKESGKKQFSFFWFTHLIKGEKLTFSLNSVMYCFLNSKKFLKGILFLQKQLMHCYIYFCGWPWFLLFYQNSVDIFLLSPPFLSPLTTQTKSLKGGEVGQRQNISLVCLSLLSFILLSLTSFLFYSLTYIHTQGLFLLSWDIEYTCDDTSTEKEKTFKVSGEGGWLKQLS